MIEARASIEPIDLRTIEKPTKRQNRFINAWLSPDSETFGNAYKSAIASGFSEAYARNITTNTRNTPWVQNAKQLFANLEPEHIYLGLQQEALQAPQPRDRIRALELMAKIRGMFIERSQSEVNVTFTNNVPRPVIPVEVVEATETVIEPIIDPKR